MSTPPTIATFSPGPYATNCYVLSYAKEGTPEAPAPCWIIDAGFEPQRMIAHIQRHNLRPEALILTHAHVDHIAGVAQVRKAFPGLPVLIHEAERDWLEDPEQNLSAFSGLPVSTAAPDRLLTDNESLTLAGHSWRVLHTPGHSPGSIALHNANLAFAGDALFAGSIGRTDFPGCSFDALARSIRTRLYTLPDDTTILPGHGPATTIGREATTNPFVRR